ncbi:histidine ammonia-lyase [Haloflavibacter putidus]|uniref:Histidine ammonia-lyase n=1 Tax=Haloflavibacter putidus TaxID=2576776 RepID=A0A507ZRQ2_9FLAO|nr:histidine ammonia-lyase [Haloflavibacter putidus]TQD40300.1 histidine ammonia-lyase [Haloflavibacter putidus]
MPNSHYISKDVLDLQHIQEILLENQKLELSEEATASIKKSRKYLDEKIKNSKEPFYGINTGFGSLCNVKISTDKLTQLQENLVISHACGTGEKIKPEIVKIMLLLKIQSLSYGHSGISLKVLKRLIAFFNNDVLPVVYEQGSLGASGDLAPLAHLALPLLGKGEVYFEGKIVASDKVLKKFEWEAIQLQSKEGLALLNGTQFMSAHAVYALLETHKLSYLADAVSAVSIDAFDCNLSPYDALVHEVRPHRGQIKTAQRICDFLEGSEIIEQTKAHVQDPYSFRCIPQVHGASKETLKFVHQTVKTEINSVTDNPNIFVNEDKIISGGNFHGQPLALGMDYLAIAVSELANISERRIYQLVSGLRNLPMFLVNDPGLNNGFMIPQYTAASIVSQNKQLCTPASIDSIVSSNGQEDHVSMGANSATKLLKVVENLKTVLAIELFNASQALYYREPLKSSEFIEQLVKAFRKEVPIVKQDKVMAEEMEKAKEFLNHFSIDKDLLYFC